jgi:hypothetical protein
MYNLGDTYSLNKSTIWNLNVPERINSFDNQAWSLTRLPGRAEDGMKDIIVDISINGTTWTEWGRFTIPKAPASGFYQGISGPDFLGKIAKYVLITGVSNHGGPCYGLSEIKFIGTVATQTFWKVSPFQHLQIHLLNRLRSSLQDFPPEKSQ